jgi:hypothetical protein
MHGLPPTQHRPRPTPSGAPQRSPSGDNPLRDNPSTAAPDSHSSPRTRHSAHGGRSASVNDAAVTTCPHRAITRPLRARSRAINSSLTRWVYPSPQQATATHPGPARPDPPCDPARRPTGPPQRPPSGDGAEGREHASTTAAMQSQAHVHPHGHSRRGRAAEPSPAAGSPAPPNAPGDPGAEVRPRRRRHPPAMARRRPLHHPPMDTARQEDVDEGARGPPSWSAAHSGPDAARSPGPPDPGTRRAGRTQRPRRPAHTASPPEG